MTRLPHMEISVKNIGKNITCSQFWIQFFYRDFPSWEELKLYSGVQKSGKPAFKSKGVAYLKKVEYSLGNR